QRIRNAKVVGSTPIIGTIKCIPFQHAPVFIKYKNFLIGGMASVHRMRLPPPRWGSPFLTG
ncbi:hypothetical protein V9W40_23730, partial [Klebsiella pneumoniae]|uniref:hypothetical protein n=1 Tax=Klebsiella pneumoniae TaxID=573 RepID=UPI00307DE41D